MAQRTVSAFKSTKNTRFADNTTGLITAGNSRDMHEDVADSFINISDQLQDDDTFASPSATKVASSESIKAYVLSQTGGAGMQSVTKVISTAEILTGNSVPVTVLAAQGAGTIIQVISPIILRWNYDTAVFATNTTSALYYNATAVMTATNTVISLNSDRYMVVPVTVVDYPDATMSNTPITWVVSGGDPTGGGSSTLTVHFKYFVVSGL